MDEERESERGREGDRGEKANEEGDGTGETFFCSRVPSFLPSRICPAATAWPAFKDWVTADGQPNLDGLRALFADVEVPVVECTYVYGHARTPAARTHCRPLAHPEP